MLAETKLNITEVLISKVLIDSYISQDESVSVNNVLIEYNEMKEKTRNPIKCCRIYYIKTMEMETYCVEMFLRNILRT